MPKSALLLFLLGGLPNAAAEATLPPPRVTLKVEAPDVAGPWKLVVTNDGETPLRLAADGRLLTLEIEPPEDATLDDPYGKSAAKKKPPPPVICRLPPELRPAGVTDERAITLGPGSRYEEVVSPALYCFAPSEAKALVPGARVTAKLGFPEAKGAPKAPPRAPFIAEPAVVTPAVAPIKEIVADRFVAAAAPPVSTTQMSNGGSADDDPNAPRLELTAPARIDSHDEKTVTTTLTLKNVGGREARLHVRRDNLLFDIDGPDGSSHCGLPSSRRVIPRELVGSLAAGASRSIEVWIGELCPNVVFDRPGLYRVRAGLAFPPAPAAEGNRAWTRTVVTKEPVLVRIRQGRLPFFTSPPQVFGGDGGSG